MTDNAMFPEDQQRNLRTDLAAIQAVLASDGAVYPKHAQLGEMAVVGWPAAIRRALAAEAQLAEIRDAYRVYVDLHGLEHEEDLDDSDGKVTVVECPQDDTCDCRCSRLEAACEKGVNDLIGWKP